MDFAAATILSRVDGPVLRALEGPAGAENQAAARYDGALTSPKSGLYCAPPGKPLPRCSGGWSVVVFYLLDGRGLWAYYRAPFPRSL